MLVSGCLLIDLQAFDNGEFAMIIYNTKVILLYAVSICVLTTSMVLLELHVGFIFPLAVLAVNQDMLNSFFI